MSLPPHFSNLPFREPARASTNLALVRSRLPEPLLSSLPMALAQVPDPDGALNALERFTRQPGDRIVSALLKQPVLLHYLLALFSHSQFLSETLIQQPELVIWLGRQKSLDRIKSKEELLEEYARFEATFLEDEPGLALARFKRRQYLRITLRDILGVATLVETTLELSTLADVLLQRALAEAEKNLRRRYGRPQTQDARGRMAPARFAVVSLGKLGGNELNYSSDVDLLFLYQGEGTTDCREVTRAVSNKEFFVRLAQGLLERVAGVTREGPVFRVDLRLRPGGGEGDLVVSLPAALHYYRKQAREWELQMLLKGRDSAGDGGLVREFLSSVEPHIFRGPMHFAVVESVIKTREQIDRKLDSAEAKGLNVKLAPGGLRDIEFLVQCLQRLYGQQDPWVRAGSTLVALHKLYDKGYISPRDHFHLASAYEFLRRVEHRLQLAKGQQLHSLPGDAKDLDLLACRCGVGGSESWTVGEKLRQELERHLQRVRAISERVLPSSPRRENQQDRWLETFEPVAPAGELSYAQLREQLRAQGSPIYEELLRLAVPVQAERSLRRFLASAMSSSATYEEVERAASALPDGLDILRLSERLGSLLVRRPERLAELLELGPEPSKIDSLLPGLEEGLGGGLPPALAYLSEGLHSLSEQMAGLRRFFWDGVFTWGARQVCRRASVERGVNRYTGLVESILRSALAVAARHEGGKAPDAGWAVIALGRLGTIEMDLGSDLDVIFVASDSAAQSAMRPVAERFIHVLSAYTREGTILPVDVRLRPHGGEGELVQTTEAVLEYFLRTAEVWEAVTYLKARPVAGDLRVGEDFCQRLQDVLRERFSDWEIVRPALAEMRKRLEEESAGSFEYRDNFKTGPGGIYDLDFLISGLALREGTASLARRSLVARGEMLLGIEGAVCLEAKKLLEAARLFAVVDHAIRLVTGEGSASLPVGQRGASVAKLASHWLGDELAPGELAARLGEVRRSVRTVFAEVFG